jgi:MinD superfamily P-loop ATPase
VLLQLPDNREIARAYSRGELAIAAVPGLEPLFADLYDRLVKLACTTPSAPHAPASRPVVQTGLDRPAETLSIRERGDVPELVVISGKGGTGKTSIVASFSALAGDGAVADCDVDAADLHLVLDPVVVRQAPFYGGSTAIIDADRCTGCGECVHLCRFDAIQPRVESAWRTTYHVSDLSCEGCGVCVDRCPEGAAALVRSWAGEWFVSDTAHGPMVHARLGIAGENSGKLVSLVRREAKAVALSKRRVRLTCDGSPGIGCPVIASVAGARMALIVTEPTLSGLHDLLRVAELCRQFRLKTGVCVNKADLNPELTGRIEAEAAALGIPVLGRVRYDAAVTLAQVARRTVVENGEGPAAADIRALWGRVQHELA